MAVLLTVCEIFSRMMLENRHFAHCIVIVDPQRRNAQKHQSNLHIAEKYT